MTRIRPYRRAAFTMVALLAIIAVLAILAAMLLPALAKAKARAQRIHCVNNLKQVGLAFRIWANDHTELFPMAVAQRNGGTREWVEGGNAFRHFQVMSNEVVSLKVLLCPSDIRQAAANFEQLRNHNVSYFVALDADDSFPTMLLAGDRNITNGLVPVRTVLNLPPDRPTGWTAGTHELQGNIAVADGSVQSYSTRQFRGVLSNTGNLTNRIALPE